MLIDFCIENYKAITFKSNSRKLPERATSEGVSQLWFKGPREHGRGLEKNWFCQSSYAESGWDVNIIRAVSYFWPACWLSLGPQDLHTNCFFVINYQRRVKRCNLMFLSTPSSDSLPTSLPLPLYRRGFRRTKTGKENKNVTGKKGASKQAMQIAILSTCQETCKITAQHILQFPRDDDGNGGVCSPVSGQEYCRYPASLIKKKSYTPSCCFPYAIILFLLPRSLNWRSHYEG